MQKDHLHNRIVREIIARVAGGTYPTNHRLPSERDLCREFNVARGTLRKALTQLREMGVLRVKPNSGIYIQGMPRTKLPHNVLPPDFSQVNLADVIEARKAIELAAFKQAVRRITAPQLHELRDLIAQMTKSLDDLPRFLDLDMAFHRAVVSASGNPVLRTAFDAIHDYHRFSSVYSTKKDDDEQIALDHHRRWLEALEKRDAAAGARILSQHLDAVAHSSNASNGHRCKQINRSHA